MKNSLYQKYYLTDNYNFDIIAYYFRKWENFNMDFHTHNQIEIMYVIKGQCVVETKDASYNMKEGHFVLIDANVPHKLLVNEGSPCRMFNIEFIFKRTDAFLSIGEIIKHSEATTSLLKSEKPYIFSKDIGEISSTFKNLISELSNNYEDKALMVQMLLSELLIKISRLINEANKQNNKTESLYVKRAIDYIHNNYDYDIKVNDIASAVNINMSYLQRLFKISQNCSLVEYLTKFRLDKAKMILANTNIPIIDVCNYVGINSRQYFTYLFKKHTCLTPKEYRQSRERYKVM